MTTTPVVITLIICITLLAICVLEKLDKKDHKGDKK